jgi:hypothetical protein
MNKRRRDASCRKSARSGRRLMQVIDPPVPLFHRPAPFAHQRPPERISARFSRSACAAIDALNEKSSRLHCGADRHPVRAVLGSSGLRRWRPLVHQCDIAVQWLLRAVLSLVLRNDRISHMQGILPLLLFCGAIAVLSLRKHLGLDPPLAGALTGALIGGAATLLGSGHRLRRHDGRRGQIRRRNNG